jgi:YaiO family outer membrane protein
MKMKIGAGMLIFFSSVCAAAGSDAILPLAQEGYKHRLEAVVYNERYLPEAIYGNNRSLVIDYYLMPRAGLTLYCESGFYSTKAGSGVLGIAGVYKDWAPWLYTFSSLSAGTNSEFLQEYRADHDFNFKVGAKKNIVMTAGGTYVKAHDVHTTSVVSPGVTAYLNKLILSFRYLRSASNPGWIVSGSSIYSAEYGAEGKSWLCLTVTEGGQGYLALEVLVPQEVRGNVTNFDLKYRKWLKKDFGFIAGAAYLKLEDSYEKYTVYLGSFKSF